MLRLTSQVIAAISILCLFSCSTTESTPDSTDKSESKSLILDLQLGLPESQVDEIVNSTKTCTIDDIYNGFGKYFFACGASPISEALFISMLNSSIDFVQSQSDAKVKSYFSYMLGDQHISSSTSLSSAQAFILVSSLLAFPSAVEVLHTQSVSILGKRASSTSWGQFILGATTEATLLGGVLTYGAVMAVAAGGVSITAISLPAIAVIGIGAAAFWAGWQMGEGLADIWNDVHSTIETNSVPGSFGADMTGYAIYEPSNETQSPIITVQPPSITRAVGQSVTFSVTATGNPTPSYQWKKNGTNISGATLSSYTIPSVQTSDAGSYTVVVTNSQGSVTSNTATLTVNSSSNVSINIVFQTDRGGSGTQQIWIVKSDGTGLRALTTGGWTYKYWPRWKPNSSQIAFVGGNTYTTGNTIRIIDTNGIVIKDLVTTTSIVGVHGICWSPDGQWIYYDESISCNDRIRKVNIANNIIDSIVVDEASYSQAGAKVNPSGTKMLFHESPCAGSTYIKVFDFALKSSVDFVKGATNYSTTYPEWQSDGAKIVYVIASSTTPYTSQISQCSSDGTGQATITTCQGSFPKYAVGDSQILFCRPKNDDISTSKWNLWMMNTDGSNLVQITTGDFSDQYVDVQ